ncbi:hypothetical protein AOB57_007445 [Methanosarcina flavescens]|uniref:Uncharacterized protein n=1 Tax=Methanosarcina flavescens TaxID=1715806 RepID=A0A660HS17_9EURY|nr:hypothetical protein AOB57_007445 [Methanosarcina flavescens]
MKCFQEQFVNQRIKDSRLWIEFDERYPSKVHNLDMGMEFSCFGLSEISRAKIISQCIILWKQDVT